MGLYLASINTAGKLGLVDTAQFIGGRIRRDNNPTPGRADVFSSAFFEIQILFYSPALGELSLLAAVNPAVTPA